MSKQFNSNEYYNALNNNELTQELVEMGLKDLVHRFRGLLKYCRKNKDFHLESKILEFSIVNSKINFTFLIDFYIELNRNELTQKLAEIAITSNLDNFRELLEYKKKFPDFFLDPKLVKISILGRFNFERFIDYCIKTNRNELTQEFAEIAIKDKLINFQVVLKYKIQFPDFYLDPELVKFSISRKGRYNFICLIRYCIKNNRNELTKELAETAIKNNSKIFKPILKYKKKFPEFNLDPKSVKSFIFNKSN